MAQIPEQFRFEPQEDPSDSSEDLQENRGCWRDLTLQIPSPSISKTANQINALRVVQGGVKELPLNFRPWPENDCFLRQKPKHKTKSLSRHSSAEA